MKFEVNLDKKWAALIVFGIFVLAGAILTYALSPSQAPPNGHTGDQIEVSIGGQAMTLQQAIDGGELSSGNSGGVTLPNCQSGEILTWNGNSWVCSNNGIQSLKQNNCYWTGYVVGSYSGAMTCKVGDYSAGISCDSKYTQHSNVDHFLYECKIYCCSP